jgi:hypothetical protein
MDGTQARYAPRIELLLRSRHAHLADDSGSPAPRGKESVTRPLPPRCERQGTGPRRARLGRFASVRPVSVAVALVDDRSRQQAALGADPPRRSAELRSATHAVVMGEALVKAGQGRR